MTTITASDLKQNSMRLQDALREDLLVTKRDKPFVVVMDYEKYRKLEKYISALQEEKVEDDGYPTISLEEANNRVAEAVSEYRKNGLKNCTEFDDAYMKELDTLIDNL
jgi:prevent-host-death family protein